MENDSDYPPGYRFSPEDEEIVSHYLIKYIPNHQPPAGSRPIRRQHRIPQVDIYRFDSPEDIKEQYPLRAVNNKDEWFFVTRLAKKYPNGGRPSRTCGDSGAGFWKPTGKDKVIDVAGVTCKRKSLEYFRGKAPGQKTDWKMHEYKVFKVNGKRASELRFPVICKLYLNSRKKDKGEQEEAAEEHQEEIVQGGDQKKDSDQSPTGSISSAIEGGGGTANNVNPHQVDERDTAVDQNLQYNNHHDSASSFIDAYNNEAGALMDPYSFDGGAAWYDVNSLQTADYCSFSYDHPGPVM